MFNDWVYQGPANAARTLTISHACHNNTAVVPSSLLAVIIKCGLWGRLIEGGLPAASALFD